MRSYEEESIEYYKKIFERAGCDLAKASMMEYVLKKDGDNIFLKKELSFHCKHDETNNEFICDLYESDNKITFPISFGATFKDGKFSDILIDPEFYPLDDPPHTLVFNSVELKRLEALIKDHYDLS